MPIHNRKLSISISVFLSAVITASLPLVALGQQTPDQVGMDRNRAAFRTCLDSNSTLHKSELHQVKMAGGNEAGVLLMSCGAFVDSYVFFCEKAGYTEAACYQGLRDMSGQAITDLGN